MDHSDTLWGPITMDDWQRVPFIKDQVAIEEDVKAGRAVFYIERDVNNEHEPLYLTLPSLVYRLDHENGMKILSIAIQAEKVNDQNLVGLRYFKGGNGVCSLEEIEFY